MIAPCFNEEQSITIFLKKLEQTLAALPHTFVVIVVDDGSVDSSLKLLSDFRFSAPNLRLQVLKLKFNVGHQMAIYQGLLYVSKPETDGRPLTYNRGRRIQGESKLGMKVC